MIRGEKVIFRKKDLVSLDHLPSAQVEDPLIVHVPERGGRRRSHVWHVCRMTMVFFAFLAILLGAAIFAIESGIFDQPLSQKAQTALDKAIGPRYKAEVGATVVRFTSGLRLALEARNVNVVDQESGKHLSTMSAVNMQLDPLALIEGRVEVASVAAEGIALDTSLLPQGDPVDLSQLRVNALPQALTEAFDNLDFLQRFVQRGGTNSVRISGFSVKLARAEGPPISLVVDNLTFERAEPNLLHLYGQVAVNGSVATLDIRAQQEEVGHSSSLIAKISNLDLKPLSMTYDPSGAPRQGLMSFADVTLSAAKADSGVAPKLEASVSIQPGTLYMDRDPQELTQANINLGYNFDRQTLEIAPSTAQFARTVVPFSGALIDLDRIDANAGKGFGIDFLIRNGTAASSISGEKPISFDGQAKGRFLSATKEFQFENLGVSTPQGALFGSLHIKLGDSSPEISFGGRADKLDTTAVKQLWPFWMASKPRIWVENNLFGGSVTNAVISVFIPAGRLREASQTGKLQLGQNELHIAFDIDGVRLNVPGEIPPLRDAKAHFDLTGPKMAVDIATATSYFPTGRTITLNDSNFSIPATYDKPLMADLDLSISGAGDAIAELLTYKPVQALQRTEFKPEDFNGKIVAKVDARIGLISDQKPPPPDWIAKLTLNDVDLLKPMSNRKIDNLTGEINADPQSVHLQAQAQIDGIPAQIDMVEPTDSKSAVKRGRVVTATLTDAQRNAVLPGLRDMIDGPVKIELTRIDDDHQGVKVDLGKAALTVPWIGWSKGSGIPASAQFEASGSDSQMTLKNFMLKGDGFGAGGDLVISKGSLSSANFDNVKLSALDDFGLSLKHSKAGAYDVTISGSSADIRPILARVKASSSGGRKNTDDPASASATVRVDLAKVVGFNDESIGNLKGVYSFAGGKTTAVDFSGVTRSGEAFVTQMSKGSNGVIRVTSGDAGAVARFTDLYKHLKGGLLNLSLRSIGQDDWDGSLDIRNFSIVDENKLSTIVSTPSGKNGKSLNSAVKDNIDTRAQSFERGFARLVLRDRTLSVENGVVRGVQVGATFQGTVKDANNKMDLTGTFMPAYGLNRLFAEVPLVGFLLGNGSDRGLIGITFRLTGSFDKPTMQINPLSIIAPGVFRQIFEF
ncbi:AsmA-like C-terminal domain-containing protein [Rhizobium freirei]|uniref:YhdP family protein n=1 Tax=Rhizobium freirei TaxID=1353277 RepID=UPI00039E18C3|nr:AsmA-like C-terminal domain-containing protein [Rhizobium freirei]